jgi:hypothetical protein
LPIHICSGALCCKFAGQTLLFLANIAIA